MKIYKYYGHNLKMRSSIRIKLSIDQGTWASFKRNQIPFELHLEELYIYHSDSYRRKTGLVEVVQIGTSLQNRMPILIGVMNFQFNRGT